MRGNGTFDYEQSIKATDAMITNIPDICLIILVADCVPILFFDTKKKVIGAAHAGWRGTVKSIAQNTVKAFQKHFNSSLKDIIVGIGPSIGPCCYEVGEEVIKEIKNGFPDKVTKVLNNKGYFNLWEANKLQLTDIGIDEKNIEVAELCTYCHADIFFSRRHQRAETGRFGGGIMLRN